jgi:transcription antitermination factor NusG
VTGFLGGTVLNPHHFTDEEANQILNRMEAGKAEAQTKILF